MTSVSGFFGITKTIVNSNSTNWVELYDNSTGTTTTRVDTLLACSDDTSEVVLQFCRTISNINYLIGTVKVPTLSGTNGVVNTVNILDVIGSVMDGDSRKVFEVPAGEKLKVKTLTAITADKTLTLTGLVKKRARNYWLG